MVGGVGRCDCDASGSRSVRKNLNLQLCPQSKSTQMTVPELLSASSDSDNVPIMQPKIILSPAWAAQEGMLDSALASLFDIDLSEILSGTQDNRCPRCGNPPADSKAQLLTDDPTTATPENVNGHVIVRCLCETVYAFAYVHEMDAQQPVGRARIRAASEATASKPDVPPMLSYAPIYDDRENSRRVGREAFAMNVEQLRKHIYSHVRLRPIAHRLRTATGEILPPVDDQWSITRVEKGQIELLNLRTHHVRELGNDNIREFRSPDFLLFRCQLTLTERDVLIEPLIGA